MTDIIMDPTTGLPELPEGHFWKVRRRKRYGFSEVALSSYEYVSGFEVVWMEPNPTGTERVYGRKYWYWFAKDYYDVRSDTPQEKAKGSVYTSVQGVRTEALELRDDEILETAIRVFEKVQADKHTLTLLGDYPPKSLTCKESEDSVS